MATKPKPDDDNNAAAAAPDDPEKAALFGHLTDAERADLTEEERAGVEDGGADERADEAEGEGEGNAGDEQGEQGEEGDEGKDGADAEGEGEGAGEGEGEGEGEEEEEEDAEVADAAGVGEEKAEDDDDEDDPLDVTRSVMPNEWHLPGNTEQQVKALDQQSADLATQFDEGDLNATEFRSQVAQIDEQRLALRMQINSAKNAFQKAASDWANKTVKAFLREHPQYSPKDEVMNGMLDNEVRRLQLKTDDTFNPRILRTAHRNIMKAMGKADDADAGARKPAGKQATKPVVSGKKPAIPPTLARVPADEIDDAGGGKFARLERLSAKDPRAFEEAMMSMSQKDRASYEEYLAGG
jgi:hypothetical protein